MTIGSLFTGTGALCELVAAPLLGGRVAWHCDNDRAAARVLAHHWPATPNLGDITAVDWPTVEPVEVLVGGFPCQDISSAGKRAGIRERTVIRAGVMACGCQWANHNVTICEQAAGSGYVPARLYAAGEHRLAHAAVRRLNLDDYLHRPYPPERVIEGTRSGLWSFYVDAIRILRPRYVLIENVSALIVRGLDRVLTDLASLGFNAAWASVRASSVGAPHRRERIFIAATDTTRDRRHKGRPQSKRIERGHGATFCGPVSAANSSGIKVREQPVTKPGRCSPAVAGLDHPPAADSDGVGREWEPERNGTPPLSEAKHERCRVDSDGRFLGWGSYTGAIRRWERTLGRLAPSPTTVGKRGGRQLNPIFVEWMLGLPGGHVTAVPGLSRNDMLRLLGNGVVPQQATVAYRWLLPLLDEGKAVA